MRVTYRSPYSTVLFQAPHSGSAHGIVGQDEPFRQSLLAACGGQLTLEQAQSEVTHLNHAERSNASPNQQSAAPPPQPGTAQQTESPRTNRSCPTHRPRRGQIRVAGHPGDGPSFSFPDPKCPVGGSPVG